MIEYANFSQNQMFDFYVFNNTPIGVGGERGRRVLRGEDGWKDGVRGEGLGSRGMGRYERGVVMGYKRCGERRIGSGECRL